MDAVFAAFITGVFSVLAVILTNNEANRKFSSQLDKQQAVTETKIEDLTREVRRHNSFAERIPKIEEKIAATNQRIDDLRDGKT